MHIAMTPCSAEEAARRVEDGRADLVVCPQTISAKGVNLLFIGEDELRFLVPPAHPWTHRGRATQIELQSLITPDRESDSYKLIREHFKSEGLELQPLIETGSDEAIKEFIRIGLGVGVLPEWSARNEMDAGKLCSIPLGRKRLRRSWCVMRSNARPATLAEDLFANLCQSVARDLMGAPPQKKASFSPRPRVSKGGSKRRK